MATQFSTLLKIALPTQGELSGSWGDVVNNNITSMVEEAIAGLKTIDTWSGNSATLSTANGTTAESRAAMLLLTDTTSDLSGAANLICPALSKVFIVKNGTGQTVTVKTSSGTGVAISNGNTSMVFCDGTNVVEAVNGITGNLDIGGNLTVGGNATVTGTTTFNGGTLTLGDSAADNVVFGADVNSSIIPNTDATFDLGSSSQEWRDIYIDGTAYIDAVNLDGTAITATAAEINLIDGGATVGTTAIADGDGLIINDAGTMRVSTVQTLAAYLDDEITAMPNLVTTAATTVGALDSGSITSGFGTIDTGSSTITTTGLITGGSLDIDDVVINGSTIGHTNDTDLMTVASGVLTVAGEISVTTLDIGGTDVTSTAAELNILDGVTSSAAELNIMDGNTSATGTTLADADRVVVNDAGTMKQVALTDFETYFESALDTLSNVTTVGTLNSGAISSGFGAVDIGSSNLTATGTISLGATSFNDNAITNVGDIALDSISADGTDINVAVSDNSATALTIKQGSDAYLIVDTANSSESVSIGTGVSGTAIVLGHSTSEVTVADNLTITGNLTVSGTTTTVNSTTVNLNDHNIVLDSGNSTSAVINGAGITIEGGSGDDATFTYNTTGPQFELKLGSSFEDLQTAKLTASEIDLNGNLNTSGTSTLTGNVTLGGQLIMPDVTSAKILVADGTSFQEVAVSGDVTIANTGAVTIAAQAVENSMLADDAVGADELAANAVVTASIVDDNVTQAKIADDAVGADQLAANAVVEASIVDNAVTLAKMAGIARGKLIIGDSSGNPSVLGPGSNAQVLTSDGTDIAFADIPGASALAADNLTAGDAAVLLTTSSGNITIDAAANNSDIIFKGTDGSADTTYLTIDGSEAGEAIFNAGLVIADAGTIGSASDKDAIAIASDGVVTFTQAPVFPDGSIAGADINIDGTTDIGAALADADEFLVDDGGGGTNRRCDMSRVKTYVADVTLTTAAQTNITSLGTLTALTVDDITINGSTISDGGDLTVDVEGDITLDANGADIKLSDNGTVFGELTNSSSYLRIKNPIQDQDIEFVGNDGGSDVTALRLDMSDAGTAIFNHDLKVADNNNMQFGAGADLMLSSDGTNGTIATPNGDLILDSADDISINADGGDIMFADAGTNVINLGIADSNAIFNSQVSNKDIIFKGNDGGSTVTALTLDMSGAGAATFNNDVTAFSDKRLKTDISNIENGIEKVMQMQGVHYKRNDVEDAKPQIGVLAQDMEAIVPEVVLTADDEMQTKSVDYGKLTAVLIEAIKDLKAEIDELKGV